MPKVFLMRSLLFAFILVSLLVPAFAFSAETSLTMTSDAGDFVGQGQRYFYTPADGSFVVTSNAFGKEGVFLSFNAGHLNSWELFFAAPDNNVLTVGVYTGAIRFPFQTPNIPGMDIRGEGRGCNQLQGNFEVKEVSYGTNNEILSFWAAFEQHCEGVSPKLWGEVRYNATIPDSIATISSSANPSFLGRSITFTAQVSSSAGTPTGTVAFKDGSAVLGVSVLSGNPATATLVSSGLSEGTHPVKAVYSGNGVVAASESFAMYQAIKGHCGLNIELSPTSAAVSSSGGSIEIDVKASSCPWDVITNNAWITVTSSAPSQGNGHISLVIDANGSAAPRIGTVSIAGRTFTVAQAGYGGQWFDLGSLGAGNSAAYGVSDDGNVVVGHSNGLAMEGGRAFRWTKNGGFMNLGTLPGMTHSSANGVSADGNVIVGRASPMGGGGRAFRWTQSAGMVDLGTLADIPYAEAYSASADGSVVVGVATDNDALLKAFRWTVDQGMIDLGAPNYSISEAAGVSADGTIVVGGVQNSVGHTRAFRWTEAAGMSELGTLGGQNSFATSISGDGATIVGFSENAAGQTRAFRWTSAEGMVPLNVLPGGNYSDAMGISADRKVIVGSSNTATTYKTAIRWTQATGIKPIAQWLTDYGMDVGNAKFFWAYATSANGNTVVGEMENGHAYVASVVSDLRAVIASAKGTGVGELTSTSDGVACGAAVCVGTFAQDQTILINATAAPGSVFESWEGCSSVNGNQCTVLVNDSMRVTATFTRIQYILTAYAEGNGSGMVSSNPVGIDCNYPGSNSSAGTFVEGVKVTVVATSPGSTVAWTGCDITGGDSRTATCTVTMNAPKAVTATFTRCVLPGVPVMSDPGLSVRSGSSYTVRWAATAGANSYDVCEATNRWFAGATCTTVSGTSQNFTHTVGSNTVYYYRVRSKNACGNASAFSTASADMAVYVDAEPDVTASVTCPESVKGGNPLDVAVTLANNTCSAPFSFSTGRVMLLGNAGGTLSGLGIYGPFNRTISPEAVVNGANCTAMPLSPATSPAKTLRVHDAVPAGLSGSTAQVMVELISNDNSVVVSGECMVPVVP